MFGWSRSAPPKSLVILSGIALAALILASGCSRNKSAGAPAQILRISQRNEPSDLDPATAGLPDEFFIIRALSEGLLSPAPTGGAPQPAAAERYEISADGLTYTFHLRADGRWSNGEPVTAGDFIASFRRVLTPATAAPKADLFYAVKNARAFAAGTLQDFEAVGLHAPDPRTVVVTLERPRPNFPLYVATGPWIPVHPPTVARLGRNWTKPENFVGNGPFTLAEWRSQQRIVVKKNPRYHAADSIKVDEIQFLRFDSGDAEERAFRAGQLDVTMSIPRNKLAAYGKDRPAELHRTLLAETHYLSFNTTRAPLGDARVRRALSLAIDRVRLVARVLLGGQEPATRVVPPPLRATPNQTGTPLPSEHRFAPDEARRLLAEAGFANGKNFPNLEITAWSPSQASVLEAVQQMWRQELGIEIAIVVREARVHLEALRSGTYDIGFVTTLLDVLDASALLADFVGGAPGNLPQWRDREFDALLARAEGQDAAKNLVTAEDLLLQRAPIAPLYFNTRSWLMSPRVQGWQDDALWTRYYHDVYLDQK